MTRRVVLAVAAASAILGAGAFAGGTMLRDPQPKPVPGERGGGSIIGQVFDRAGTRILTITDNDPTSGAASYEFSPGQEILVRQLVLTNAYFSQGVAEDGGLTLSLPEAGSGTCSLFFPIRTYGAQVFPFDPPLLIRAGDTLVFSYRNVGSPTGVVQAAFHGTAPVNATGIVSR